MGRGYLLSSAMIDPTWKRGTTFGQTEVTRYVPRRTLRLKFACDDRTNLALSPSNSVLRLAGNYPNWLGKMIAPRKRNSDFNELLLVFRGAH